MPYPSVGFACSDPATGERTCRVTQITVDDRLHLEGDSHFHFSRSAVVVDGRPFALEDGLARGAGNRCWDAAPMNAVVVADLLNWLWARKWSVIEGDDGFWERWEKGLTITAEQVVGMVEGR